MKKLLLLVITLSFHVHAQDCKIQNYSDAIECIEKDAYKRYQEGEMKHSVGVTKLATGKKAFELMTGKVSSADYVGVVEVHYDEDQILYYEISKGENIVPVLVSDYNIADIMYDVPALENFETERALLTVRLEIPLVGSMKDFHFQ